MRLIPALEGDVIELRILGPMALSGSCGRDVEAEAVGRQPKRAALLAYLAAAVPHGLHRRDRLVSLFWPESAGPRARAALSQAIYVLRTGLGERAIVTSGDDEVGLDPEHVWCDVAAFETALDAGDAAAALRLYRGDLLDGFFVAEAPEFEQWADRERDRLRQRASDGAWTLAESTARSDPLGAGRWARRAAELLPTDEAVVRRLMGFLHGLGDRAAAIRAYEAFAWKLTREFDLEPSSETQALAGAIRREVQQTTWTLAPASVFGGEPASRAAGMRPVWSGLAVFAVAAFAVAAWGARREPDLSTSPIIRVSLEFSAAAVAGPTLAMSPDGGHLAYVDADEAGTLLALRPADRSRSIPVPNTRGASMPFFSPDGKWLAFVADGRIRKVRIDGGPALPITELPSNVPGASWGANDVIVFASGVGGSALWSVPASGGPARVLARPDTTRGEVYRWPEALPDGRAAVFTVASDRGFRLATVSIESGVVRDLGLEGTNPHFVSPDKLIFARMDGALLGVSFDPGRLETRGPVFPVTDGVMVGIAGAAKLAVSRSGALAYVREVVEDRTLVAVDRQGVAHPLAVRPRAFSGARVSPDGSRVAVVTAAEGGGMDIWMLEQQHGSLAQWTSDGGSGSPTWSLDGSRLTYAAKPGGRTVGFEVRSRAIDGTAVPELLLAGDLGQMPADFTPDGAYLVFERLDPSNLAGDIWMLAGRGGAPPRPYLRTRFHERGPTLSPDGRWLAYVSNESGADEVYVAAFPDPSSVVRVSHAGGREPRWGPDARELFYRSSAGMEVAGVNLSPVFEAGAARVLFRDDEYVRSDHQAAYDVYPDGRGFLMVREGRGSDQVELLLNAVRQTP